MASTVSTIPIISSSTKNALTTQQFGSIITQETPSSVGQDAEKTTATTTITESSTTLQSSSQRPASISTTTTSSSTSPAVPSSSSSQNNSLGTASNFSTDPKIPKLEPTNYILIGGALLLLIAVGICILVLYLRVRRMKERRPSKIPPFNCRINSDQQPKMNQISLFGNTVTDVPTTPIGIGKTRFLSQGDRFAHEMSTKKELEFTYSSSEMSLDQSDRTRSNSSVSHQTDRPGHNTQSSPLKNQFQCVYFHKPYEPNDFDDIKLDDTEVSTC